MESRILEEVLAREAKTTLYHYTNQAGLLGIIKNKEIWATHTQYLNDAREFRHAVEVVKDVIRTRLTDAVGKSRHVLQDMALGVQGIEAINVCVCSFSEERDSLSQWRAYGGPTSGYAIGINPSHLAEMVRLEEFYLTRCLYKPTEQTSLIGTLVAKILVENMDRLTGENQEEWIAASKLLLPRGGSLAAYLNSIAPVLKHESFAEEREWRIISQPLPCGLERFGFRPGVSMLIPYYRVPIAYKDQSLKLDEVIIGPTPNVEQSRSSVRSFLVSQGLEKVPVEVSAVPYRNW